MSIINLFENAVYWGATETFHCETGYFRVL